MVNFPFFTSLVPSSTKLSKNFLAAPGFCSVASASAAAMLDLDIAAAAIAFIAHVLCV